MTDASPIASISQLSSSGFDASHPATVALKDAASTGNGPLFKSILASASDPQAHLIGPILLCAISGGVPIWKIILVYKHSLMNAEIGHHGSILGYVDEMGNVKLTEYLLNEGVDVEHAHWAYKPILPYASNIGASKEIIDLHITHGATIKTLVHEDD